LNAENCSKVTYKRPTGRCCKTHTQHNRAIQRRERAEQEERARKSKKWANKSTRVKKTVSTRENGTGEREREREKDSTNV